MQEKQVSELFKDITGRELQGSALTSFKRWQTKVGVDEIEECIWICVEQYGRFNSDGSLTNESIDFLTNKIMPVIKSRKKDRENPELKNLYTIKHILMDRGIVEYGDYNVLIILQKLYAGGVDISILESLATTCQNFSEFYEITVEEK